MRLAIRIFMIMVLGAAITVVTSSSAVACGAEGEPVSERAQHDDPITDSSDQAHESEQSGDEHADAEAGGACPEKESEGCQDCTDCSCCPALSTSVLAVSTTLPPPHELPEFADEPSDYEASASPGFVPGIFKPPRA